MSGNFRRCLKVVDIVTKLSSELSAKYLLELGTVKCKKTMFEKQLHVTKRDARICHVPEIQSAENAFKKVGPRKQFWTLQHVFQFRER